MGNKWFVENWFKAGKEVSWKLAWLSLDTLLYFQKPFQTEHRFTKVQEKHEFVLGYLDKIYNTDLRDYKDNTDSLPPVIEKNIWVFWNSGIKSMPPIVDLCQKSLKRYCADASVRLLTMDNLNEYLNIPELIMERYKSGAMSLAFLTDYIRISLLEKYGGLWLDATILVTQDIPDQIFSSALYSLHTPYEKTIFVNDNKIHCYVLGGRKGFSFFSYVRQEIEKYWASHDFMIDYYLLDYTIMHAYRNNDSIRSLIDNLKYTPPSLYEIVKAINMPADSINLTQIEQENIFSKLNWRIAPKLECKGKPTVYKMLLEEMSNYCRG